MDIFFFPLTSILSCIFYLLNYLGLYLFSSSAAFRLYLMVFRGVLWNVNLSVV
jgi:hypothetical protein